MEIVKELLNAGADVHAKDGRGRTALTIALEKDNKEIVNLLKKYGAQE
jgi:ankyrin repeat protein